MICKNCSRSFQDDYGYCPHCGQKSDVGRLNFKELVKDLWMAFSSTDAGFLLLTRQLVYRPGRVAREYIGGRRKMYFNPFSFLAIMVAVALFFLLQFEGMGVDYSQMAAEDTELLRFSFKYFNIFILFMCPIYGLVIWLLFLGNKTNYVENLALAAYLSGQTMLYYILAIIVFLIFPETIGLLGFIIGFLISLWYVIAILQFYQTRSIWSIMKAVLVLIIAQFISQGLIMGGFSIYTTMA